MGSADQITTKNFDPQSRWKFWKKNWRERTH
jgi:hypothetical protein